MRALATYMLFGGLAALLLGCAVLAIQVRHLPKNERMRIIFGVAKGRKVPPKEVPGNILVALGALSCGFGCGFLLISTILG